MGRMDLDEEERKRIPTPPNNTDHEENKEDSREQNIQTPFLREGKLSCWLL